MLEDRPSLVVGLRGFPARTSLTGGLRLSRVVQLILDAELGPAKGLGVLVDWVLEPGMTRYQFIDALLELSSELER